MSAAGDALGDAIKTAIENAVASLTDPTETDNDDRTVIMRAIGNAIVGSASSSDIVNLKIKNNSVDPNNKLDISWDKLFVGGFESTSFSATIDMPADLDTGIEKASTMYYIQAMAGNGKSDICKFSESYNNPVLPSGYSDSRYIGLAYNSAGSNLWTISQKNKNLYFSGAVTLFSVTLSGTTYFNLNLTTKGGIPNLNTITELNCESHLRHNSTSPDIVHIYDYDGTTRIRSVRLYDRDATGGIYFQYTHYVNSDQISINSEGSSNANYDMYCTGFKLNI